LNLVAQRDMMLQNIAKCMCFGGRYKFITTMPTNHYPRFHCCTVTNATKD